MQASPRKVIETQVSLQEVAPAVFGASEQTARSIWPVIQLLRPKQWIKNGFVIAPLIFSSHYTNLTACWQTLLATIIFCVSSSAIYIFNDLCDLEKDLSHPEKRHKRPLASGLVSVTQAKYLLVALLVALVPALVYQPQTAKAIIAYALLNIAYSLKLKKVPVVDIFCVATGFVLRVFAGGLAISVPISYWMLITTLCLALYLAVIKRKQELRMHGEAGRVILRSYTVALLDRYAEFAAICSVLFYVLFVIEVRPKLAITVPLVLFGFFRYGFIVEGKQSGESPTDAIWSDLPLALVVLAWIGLSAFALWPV